MWVGSKKQALAALDEMAGVLDAQQGSTPAAPPDAPRKAAPKHRGPIPRRGRGRPPTDTAPITLRPPDDLRRWLIERAYEVARATGKQVTIQQTILRIVEEARDAKKRRG
jgi:hypothetical protein